MIPDQCTVARCKRPLHSSGLCSNHYSLRRAEKIRDAPPPVTPLGRAVTVETSLRAALARGRMFLAAPHLDKPAHVVIGEMVDDLAALEVSAEGDGPLAGKIRRR